MAENENKNPKSDLALREERILEFWRENNTFQKSLDKESPKGNYVFYDGPPFATGLMHYGHILGSTAKDLIGRYQTMRGYHVPRRWGWDCHGLPIENIVEKDLLVAGHKEIEELGIEKFVEYARSKVLEYDKEWERGVERIGRWVDFRGGYKTMDNTFIESAWWALAEMNKKELIYEGVKVLAYCARCETPIANSEIAMDNSYRDISDISVYVKFELVDEPGTYLLAWTTTPWTLPGNTAIAIDKNSIYQKIKIGDEFFILAKDTVGNVLKDKEYSFISDIKGELLLGKNYKPLFPYYETTDFIDRKNIWKIWHADFVTMDKGTGIAHEAPAFGEDDMNLAKANNIPWISHVDETGRFKNYVTDFAGQQVKPKSSEKDGHQTADVEIIKYLAKSNLLFAKEKIIHSYPHCMRCDTPIIYYALPSWFINIGKVKNKIIEKAESMNWVPAHLKDGRFKNIVEGAPDWNISRNRYWASPLPIWKCEKCSKIEFIDSVASLKEKTKKSGNKYFVMRHGEADHNLKGLASGKPDDPVHLTKLGKDQVREQVAKLREQGVDLIIASPFVRTKETAKIVHEGLGLPKDALLFDERLREIDIGIYNNGPWAKFHEDFPKTIEYFDQAPEGGESYERVKGWMMNFIHDVEIKFKNRNVLIITHGGPGWLLLAGSHGYDAEQTLVMIRDKKDFHYLDNAEVMEIPYVPFPHNDRWELDVHRPYIDKIKLLCTCGDSMQRIPEVLDSWFESGSMPFAQDHYPFENKDWQKNNFPAGFVAEYIAQTRTWFYYTHAVSTILFNDAPFRNVVTTGTLRAEDGQKMSKSKANFPDPNLLFDKYGVDALRIYLMSSSLMKGEDANFSEKSVQEISSKVIGRLFNVVSFYELYRDTSLETKTFKLEPNSNILDKWILSRLNQVIKEVTDGMEAYDMALASRPMEGFVDDLSTWYLRRSRERMKSSFAQGFGRTGDNASGVKETLYFVLKNFAKVIAPFAPFTAEDIWQRLKNDSEEESVHLCAWLDAGEIDEKLLKNMEQARDIVTLGLQARQKANIKVRQPLASLKVKAFELGDEYKEIILDEINVKEITEDQTQETEVVLNTEITPELKQEGDYRELVRALQDMRKEKGLVPSDVVTLTIDTSEEGEEVVNKFKDNISKTVGAKEIVFARNEGTEIKIDELSFVVSILK